MLIVKKFGGTSVGNIDRIKQVANHIVKAHQAGESLVVVVSAMSGETDKLIAAAHQANPKPSPRELAVITSTGEQVSMALLAMHLQSRGVPAFSYTGGQAGIITDASYDTARIEHIDTQALTQALSEGKVAIVAGFQGVTAQGDITVLGRGGSDTTAVALAAALHADECQIYTDVDGIYTADPRMVSDARRLEHISFAEMMELTSLGAKVLQKRSVEFVGKYRIRLRVLSSFVDGPGTLITFEDTNPMEQAIVSGIAFSQKEAKLCMRGMPDSPHIAATLTKALSDAGIEMDLLIQHTAADGRIDFTCTIARQDYLKAFTLFEEMSKVLGATEVRGDQQIAKVTLVGIGLRSHQWVAQKMFSTLADEGIPLQLISTGEIKISVIMDEKYVEQAVRALHQSFDLARTA